MYRHSLLPGLVRKTVVFSVGVLAVYGLIASAQVNNNPIRFFKNYFVTGDYVVAGVGLRGTGVNGFATGTINMNAVPCTSRPAPAGIVPCDTAGSVPADIVAAFLYWEAEETASTPSSIHGFFRGNAIVGKVVGSPDNRACLSSGGPSGTTNGSGRVYRSDVLRYLAIDHTNNVRLGNGLHEVKLPDSGGNGNGNTSLADGATLVLVYRMVVPGQPRFAPLRAVVSYDGAYTLNKFSDNISVTMGGFYQASPNPAAKMTAIVANGQPGFQDSLNITTGNRTATFHNSFTGAAGPRWDNPTFPVDLSANDSSYSAQMITGTNQACLTVASIWSSTNVVDTDFDGLLDVWETSGMHLDAGDDHHAASFGGCSNGQPCVDLPNMGANPATPDVFVELDWMSGTDADGHSHTHIPKYAALNAMGESFALHGISLHFDVGSTEYAESPFIVPASSARGGEVIDESTILCHPSPTNTCAFNKPYSVLSWKKGFNAIKSGFRVLGIERHFDRIRKDIFHYGLFAHAMAGPFDATGAPLTSDPSSVSGVADRPGGDVMITLGLWRSDDPAGCDPRVDCADQTGTAQVQAGTFMHELGHNLGLAHAGLVRVPNCSPIYPSVMNYLYQSRGLTDAAGVGHIDYSNGSQTTLDEDALPDTNISLGNSYRIRFFGPPIASVTEGTAKAYCGGASNAGAEPAVRLESLSLATPDWHRNGPGGEENPLDVNYNGSIEGSFHANSRLLLDSNDWGNLNLQQVGARRNVNGLSSDVGEADLGEADLGEADLGEADLGEADLGEADLGEADLGEADLGEADLGDTTFEMEISALDATSALEPLTAQSNPSWIALAWGHPGIGQIRSNRIYRMDAAHPSPTLIGEVTGAPPIPTFKDLITDFTHSGANCPVGQTCYNTEYTYYITSVDVHGTQSAASNTVSSIVNQSFVTATGVVRTFGAPNPAFTYTMTGVDPGGTISCGTTATQFSNAGTYAITCTGTSTGVTYIAGTLTITKANAIVVVTPYNVSYDGNPHTATYTVTGVAGDLTAAGSSITLNTTHTNAGIYASDSWSFSGGINYNDIATTFITDRIIGPAQPGSMTAARSFHTATLLSNGKVLVTGGYSSTGALLASAELYDPVARTFSPTGGNMPNKAAGQSATLLQDGKVLVVGGGNSSSEIYDPVTGIWKSGGGISGQRTHHTATLLPSGKVLIAGGSDAAGKTTNTALLFDPSTGAYSNTGNLKVARDFHTATLVGGKVLITGGRTRSGSGYVYQNSAELYDPSTGAFTTVASLLSAGRYGHNASLFNGKVLLTGGANVAAVAATDVFDPATGTFSIGPALTTARQYFTATVVGNTVVAAGGLGSTALSSVERYQNGAFQLVESMTTVRAGHTATLLSDGSILITGGQGSGGTSIATTEMIK